MENFFHRVSDFRKSLLISNKIDVTVLEQILADKEASEYFFRNDFLQENFLFSLFEPLKSLGAFSVKAIPKAREIKENDRTLIDSPFWPALLYLEILSAKLDETHKSISDFLQDFIISSNATQSRLPHRNFRIDRSLIIIMSNIPTEHLKTESIATVGSIVDFDMGGTAAEIKDKLAPKILKSHRLDLIQVFVSEILKFTIRERENYFGEGTYKEFDSILTDYWFREIIQDHRTSLVSQYPKVTRAASQATIEAIIAEDNKQFAWYTIKTIEDNDEHRYPNVHDYEYILSDLLRDTISNLPSQVKKSLIESYLQHKHEYFIRLAIYLIGQAYREFGALFWAHFSLKNPLRADAFRFALHHEIFEFVKFNAEILEDDSIGKLISWIEDLENSEYADDAKARGAEWLKKRTAYDKLEWYKEALKNSPSARIHQKIKENEAICDWERAIPAGHYSGPIGPATVVHDESPKKSEEISEMSIPEVAKYLLDFGLVDDHNPDKPNSSGLARELETDVKNRSQEYSANISEFQIIPYYYLQRLLWAFQSSWRDGRPLSWENILQFIEKRTEPAAFWSKMIIEDRQANEQAALAGAMIGLLNDGLGNHKNKFPSTLLSQAQGIILHFIEKFPFKVELSTMSINDYINTTPGRIFEAAINIWWAIENEIKKGNQLENKILPEYEKRFTMGNSPNEFFYSLGQGFRGFWYYNKEWTQKNIHHIFSNSASNKLILSLNGFFETVPAVYTDIYKYFQEENLFHRAINNLKNIDERAKEILAHQILLGGIESSEDLKDENSTIKSLISNSDSHTLSRICWLFWHYISEGNKKVYAYMLDAWQLINERLNAIPDSDKDKIIAYLLRWPELIDSWSAEVPGLIENTMAHLPRQRSVDYIIEAFHKHYNNSQNLVIESFKGVLNKKHFPTYPTDKLIFLVETMYTDGHKNDANIICNAYGEAGIYYLKPIWEKYNNALK